jgi:hypothetical protein
VYAFHNLLRLCDWPYSATDGDDRAVIRKRGLGFGKPRCEMNIYENARTWERGIGLKFGLFSALLRERVALSSWQFYFVVVCLLFEITGIMSGFRCAYNRRAVRLGPDQMVYWTGRGMISYRRALR